MSSRLSIDDPHLREEDRLIRTHLNVYPLPPRPVVDRWWHFRDSAFLLIGLFFLVAIPVALGYWVWFLQGLLRGEIVGSVRTWILQATTPIAIYAFIAVWIYPVRCWWLASTSGRPAVATLREIVNRTNPIALLGSWTLLMNGREVNVRFRVNSRRNRHETWVQTIRPGDRIHVLVHPTKDEVLFAYGPIDA